MIVGLCGRAGSGKTTCANYLIRTRGFTRHAFADPLKRMLRVIGLTESQLWGEDKDAPSAVLQGKTPRFAMQTLGTEWGRDMIGPAFWEDIWRRTLPMGDVVCDDVRFPTDVDLIHRLGGIVIEIDRLLPADNHSSEAMQFVADESILNFGTIEEMEADLAGIVDSYEYRAAEVA